MALVLVALQGRWWCPMCGSGTGWGWGMMFGMSVFWLLIIVLFLALAWRLVTQRGSNGGSPGSRTPEDTLRERYARGEIDRETYQRMMADLHRPPEP